MRQPGEVPPVRHHRLSDLDASAVVRRAVGAMTPRKTGNRLLLEPKRIAFDVCGEWMSSFLCWKQWIGIVSTKFT